MIYAGYRDHLGFSAVKILREGSIIVYCLPSHTSGETQPLNVKLLGPFKSYLNVAISTAVRAIDKAEFGKFDLLHFISKAYSKSFKVTMFYVLLLRRVYGLRVLSLLLLACVLTLFMICIL